MNKGVVAQEEVNLSVPIRNGKMHFSILLSLKWESNIKMTPVNSRKNHTPLEKQTPLTQTGCKAVA